MQTGNIKSDDEEVASGELPDETELPAEEPAPEEEPEA
jgi:hypothetical protein